MVSTTGVAAAHLERGRSGHATDGIGQRQRFLDTVMLGITVFSMVLTAIAIIVGSVIWGWRNGRLWESDRERFDRQFDEIVTVADFDIRRRGGSEAFRPPTF